MVFIPKHFGDVPGNVSFFLASTIGAVTKSQARSGVQKKKSHNCMKNTTAKDYALIVTIFFLLKEISEYNLMIIHRFQWEVMG